MARKSTVKDTPKKAVVRATRSFDGLVIGETFETELSGRAIDLITGGYLEVVSRGESESGPGPADESDQGGGPESAEAEGSAGAQPGEDSRAG